MSELALPEGWVSSPIGSVNVYKSKNIKPFDFSDTVFELYSVPVFFSGYPEILEGKEIGSLKSVVEKDDVLICKINPRINRVWIVKDFTEHSNIASSEWIVFRQPLLNPKFMKYYYQSLGFRDKLCADVSGVGGSLTRAKPGEVAKYQLPIAPIVEQNKISDLLDNYLTTVSQIQARLDAIPKLIGKFRQSVLNDAFCGKLTEEWRKNNNEEGNAFIDQIEIDRFRTQKLIELPKNWQWLKFDTVADIASNLQDPKLMPKAIHLAPNHIAGHKGKVIEISTIEADNVKSAKHGFTKGQIIYSKIRPYLCKVVIADFDGLCSADMYPINSKVETKYLLYWMLSAKFTYWASNAESRSVLPKINQKDLNQIPTPTAPIKEQKEIVRLIEILFAYADQIEKSVATAKARVDNLTQSILHQAFTGNLTAEWRKKNPELISGDNSAEALLAKIKAEKQGSSKKGKAKQ